MGKRDDDEFQKWLVHMESQLPAIKNASVGVAWGGEQTPEGLLQLGALVWYDKPILIAVTPGEKIPKKVLAVADEIVELDRGPDGEFHPNEERMMAALRRMGVLD